MNLTHLRNELKRKDKPFRFLWSRVLLKTHLCKFLSIRTHGYQIHFHPSELSCDVWYDPGVRDRDINFLKTFLKAGDTYVDVGANIGTTVLAAAMAVGETGQVIAIEPHPRIFGFLEANVGLNGLRNVNLRNVALGNRSDNVFFSNFKADDLNRVLPSSRGTSVSMITLDSLLEGQTAVSLLKIDVEGYEKYVLEGAANVIGNVGCIYMEFLEPNFKTYGYSGQDVIDCLEKYGFEIYQFKGDTVLSRLHVEGKWMQGGCDIIALRTRDDFIRRTKWTLA